MADKEKKPLNIQNLEVTELEDTALDGVAGGNEAGEPNVNCPCNYAPGCGVQPPQPPIPQ